MTPAQELKLRLLCERYEVDFDPSHYYVSPADSYIMPGWAEGWIGGHEHARVGAEEGEQQTVHVGRDWSEVVARIAVEQPAVG